MVTKDNIYKIVFISIIIVQALIMISVPLIHLMNDSGWYFMNVHFVNTGSYITESRYPSFDEPSQYYPFFGYSFVLFICEKISLFLGIGFSGVVKNCQFLMYVISGILVKRIIFQVTKKEKLAFTIGIVFLLYYPYFNYVNLLMSETYAAFLILLLSYFFLKTQIKLNKLTATILFLLAGYIILVKPVFLPISIAIIILYSITVISARKYSFLIFILYITVLPISQSIFSKIYYDNYKLQTGFGWHMWDRVIFYDQEIPQSSEALNELKLIYKNENKPVSYGYWWDVTKDLSEFGYDESETQEICKNIAIDAIVEKPVKFISNTIKNCYNNFLMDNLGTRVYLNSEQYLSEIEKFSHEQQHKPLTNELSKQSYYQSFLFNDLILSFNYSYAKLSKYISFIFHNSIVFLLFVLAGIHTIYILLTSKFKRNRAEFIIWFTAFSVIFGSNLAEYPQARLMQPAVIFIIMVLSIKLNELKLNLSKNKRH